MKLFLAIIHFWAAVIFSFSAWSQAPLIDLKPKVSIEVLEPSNYQKNKEIEVRSSKLTITIKVESIYDLKKVLIGGKKAQPQMNGTYCQYLTLHEGKNNIKVYVSDVYEKVSEEIIYINYSIKEFAPNIEIISPKLDSMQYKTTEDELVIHCKVIGNNSQLKHLLVNNEKAAIQLDNTYLYTLKLTEPITNVVIYTENKNGYSDKENIVIHKWSDKTPPSISILSPLGVKETNGMLETHQKNYTIRIQIKDNSLIDSVLWNNESISIDNDGIFEQNITLKYGRNDFNIKATDKFYNSATKKVTIICKPDISPPTIRMLAPDNIKNGDTIVFQQNRYYTLAGIVKEIEEELFDLTINEEEIPLPLKDNSFSKSVLLKKGINEIKIAATDKKQNRNTLSFYINRQVNNEILPKVALVIGNANYAIPNELHNPVNDAIAMEEQLKSLGFKVLFLKNGTKQQMRNKIREFQLEIEKHENKAIGFFFYSGHGTNYNNEDYLIPIDMPIGFDIEEDAIKLSIIMNALEKCNNPANFIFLDACRDNKFSGKNKSLYSGKGLLQGTKKPTQSIICYATQPGETAEDGKDKNSPFTIALLNQLRKKNITIEEVIKQTMIEVKKSTKNKQKPSFQSSFDGEFIFGEE